MPFDSPDYDLAELLKDTGNGKIQLPDFQREWKWDDDRIASLLASISVGYPIGVIMLLQVGGDSVRFAPKPIAGANGAGTSPELLLLDGQQRLTSLYQSLSSGKPVETTDSRGKRLRRWYYVDIRRALDPDADQEDAIISVPEDRIVRGDFGRVVLADYSTIEKECDAETFPLSRLFEHGLLVDWQMAYANSAERLARWKEFHERVLRNVLFYKLPAIILTKETPKEAVCVVFEKVNTGGVPLNVFELLTATFAADGFRLKEDWDQRKRILDRRAALQGIENTDLLQAITLMATRERRQRFVAAAGEPMPGISAKRKDVLRLTLDDYVRWADPLTEALEWCAKFLAEQRIFRADDVPYKTQLVPLAAIKVALGSGADNHAASEKLRQWYWCGVLGELYGGTTETRFARDLEQVVPWISDGGPPPGTVAEATFRAGRLLTMRTRNSAAYKGVYALLMKSDCRDWIKNEPINMATFFDLQVDIHHIFPKAWCERNGIDAARRESIVNKTALAYSTNRSIGGRSPSEYITSVERQAGLSSADLDVVIERHAIEPTLLRSADFDGFFQARSDELLQLIEEAMGKSPVRDDIGEGDPNQFEAEPEEITDDLLTREDDLLAADQATAEL